MFESLNTYLGMYATREQTAMILGACYELSDAGVSELESQIHQEIEIADNVGDHLVIPLVNGYLLPAYHRVVGEFGVTLNDQIQLPGAVSVLQALRTLEHWSDHETLVDLLSTDEDPVDRLCSVLDLVGANSVEEYLSYIDTASEALLERLSDIHERALDHVPVEPPSEHRVRAAAIAKRRVQAIPSAMSPEAYTLLTEFLNENGRLGLGAPVVNIYADRLSKMRPTEMASELFALLCATEVETRNLTHHVKYLLEQLDVSDLDFGAIGKRLDEYLAVVAAQETV